MKQKSLSSLKKRIKVTAKGHYKRSKAGRKHLLSSKSRARKRALSKATLVDKTFTKKIRRLLPGY
ncbi:MAG: 50S ribosomal protein L35 [candidate division WOR-3 bacterium]